MERHSEPVAEVNFTAEVMQPRRVRLVDWAAVLKQLDQAAIDNPEGEEWGRIGVFDQSLRTHIRQGRYAHIDPTKYEVTTRRAPGEKRSRAILFMRRKPGTMNESA